MFDVALQSTYPGNRPPLRFLAGPRVSARISKPPDASKELKKLRVDLDETQKTIGELTMKLARKDVTTREQNLAHARNVLALNTELEAARTELEEARTEIQTLATGLDLTSRREKEAEILGLETQLRICEDKLSQLTNNQTPAGREPEVDNMENISFSNSYTDRDAVKRLWESFLRYQIGYINRSPSQRVKDVYPFLKQQVTLLVTTLNGAHDKKKGFHDIMLQNLDRIVFLLWFCVVCYQPYFYGDFILVEPRAQNGTQLVIKKFNRSPGDVSNKKMKETFRHHENGIPEFYHDHIMQAASGGNAGIETNARLLEPISSTNSFLFDGSTSKLVQKGEYNTVVDGEINGWKDGFKGMHRLRARLGLFEKSDWFHDDVLKRVSTHLIENGILTETGTLGRRRGITEDKLTEFLLTKGMNILPPPSFYTTIVEEAYQGTSRQSSSSSKRSTRRRSRRHSRRRSPSRRSR